MTSVDLVLGARPDEPGPPVGGPAAYPTDVETRLAADAQTIIARYPQPRSALLPLLHLVQSEDGYLTRAGIAFCGRQVGLTDAEVTAVATFYSMYRRTPTGRYLVGVCTNTLCAIMGGDAILDTLETHLGIRAGQTTGDGTITLEHLECNAACDYAPVIMVNWQFYDNQTPSAACELADSLRTGTPAPPTRGTLATYTSTERTLAGLNGPAAGTRPGAATLAGLRLARELDMEAPAVSGPSATTTSTTTTGNRTTADTATGTEPAAVESVRDEPAPGPSATLPPESATPDTDPDAAESGN